MSFLVLKEITLELSSQPGHFLEEIAHLILELNLDGRLVDKVNLLSREAVLGTWEADQVVILREVDKAFTLSVFLDIGTEERQLLGYIELYGLDLYDRPGDVLDIPLMGNESMVLKTKVQVMTMEDVYRLALRIGQANKQTNKELRVQKQVISNVDDQIDDFLRHGNLDSLNQAISQLQHAARTSPESDSSRTIVLSRLGVALIHRFERLGNLDDLENAIVQFQTAVKLTPNGHPQRPSRLANLGTSLITQFERLGNIEDLDNAVAQLQTAIKLTPEGDPNKPDRLTNLGLALETRFERLGNIADIDNAVIQQRAAVSLTPDSDPSKREYLNNFGNSLVLRFKRFKNTEDIDNAIVQQQAAVSLIPDSHPRKPTALNNLGVSLRIRFQHFGNIDDINAAIAQQQLAIKLSPDRHADKSSLLSNLANSLAIRFEQFGNVDDNDQSITQQLLAADLIPHGHPNKLAFVYNLGMIHLFRFLRTRHPRDAETAIFQLSAAAKSLVGTPSIRLNAAKEWIRVASIVQHSSLLAAHECALAIIPRIAWLGLSITDRHQHLVQTGAIARNAAATAISLQQHGKAIEWLEQGRSIVWTQILQLRTPVDQLRSVDSNLADDLLRVSRLLDGGGHQCTSGDGKKLTPEEEGRTYRALAAEWESLVHRVKSLPNFEDFLTPPSLPRLFDAVKAKDGPVVVLNVAEKRCDALVLIDGLDDVVHIPLPKFTFKVATQLQDELRTLLTTSGIRVRAKRDPDPETGSDAACKRILAELWDCLVKPILDSLAFSPHPDTLPRIWWCVTGPLTFLPIHAAGIYDGDSTNDQIHDYVVSSYTPTLSALLESPRTSVDIPFKMLSVIEPSIGRWHIPNTRKELEYIRLRLGNRDHVVLEALDATKERVMKAVEDTNWLHLACHGSQEANNPTKSALKLRDGDLTLEEIIKLDLPQAEFAFLSACQTVTGEETLSEEAAHIAGGMLLAGYRNVVATMWSIEDKLAPEVADEFYRHLMEDGGRPDSRKTAEALHLSVQKLRKKPGISMVAWIPFVHLGV